MRGPRFLVVAVALAACARIDFVDAPDATGSPSPTPTTSGPVELTVSVSGAGTVVSEPAGITCPGACTATFTAGTVVTLTATAETGSALSEWTGACATALSVCAVPLDAPASVSATFATRGSPVWALAFGGGGADNGRGIAVDGGDVFVTGSFRNTASFGCTSTATSLGAEDVFMTRRDRSTGACSWVRAVGGTMADFANDVVAAADRVFMTGTFASDVTVGGSTLSPAPDVEAAYLIALDAESGTDAWGHASAASGDDQAVAITALSTAGVMSVGTYAGTAVDTFWQTFDRDGGDEVFAEVGGLGDQTVTDVAASSTSRILAGTHNQAFTIGGEMVGAPAGVDAWVAKLDATGSAAWTLRIGGIASETAVSVAIAPDGTVWIAGDLLADFTVGAVSLTKVGTDGAADVYLLKVSPDGVPLAGWSFGGNGEHVPTGIAVAPDGTIAIAGWFSTGAPTFGGRLPASAGDDAFVAKITPDGAMAWALRVGGGGLDRALDVAVDTLGGAYVAGEMTGSVTVGSTTIGNGGRDAFVVRLAP